MGAGQVGQAGTIMAAIEMGRDRRGDAGLLPALGGAFAMLAAAAIGGAAAYGATFLLTDMAPMLAAIGGAMAYFAMAHYLVHEWRGVEPIRLLTVNFFFIWALLFLGGVAVLVTTALAGAPGGPPAMAILAGPPVLAALLTALPALAVGDRAPAD